MVGHECFILKGVFCADGNDRLAGEHSAEAYRPASVLSPGQLLFQDMEQRNGIAQAA